MYCIDVKSSLLECSIRQDKSKAEFSRLGKEVAEFDQGAPGAEISVTVGPKGYLSSIPPLSLEPASPSALPTSSERCSPTLF